MSKINYKLARRDSQQGASRVENFFDETETINQENTL